MPRTFITVLSSLTMVASLSLSPAYAQSRGSHVAAAPQTRPASHTPSTTAKPAPMTVAQRIDAHPQLVTRLTPLLPAGMTLDQAAQGFKNEGQFIAALHVSHNLNIPFDKLKAEMTGTDHDSLGKAIHDLQPTANAKAEARKAEAEAKADQKAAGKKVDTDDRDDK
ncbi:MAG: hypothetical protein HY047_20655 [Acidobacteria bacterium]|nr:hypothetical protein [Acidobacteriota bacterium]